MLDLEAYYFSFPVLSSAEYQHVVVVSDRSKVTVQARSSSVIDFSDAIDYPIAAVKFEVTMDTLEVHSIARIICIINHNGKLGALYTLPDDFTEFFEAIACF